MHPGGMQHLCNNTAALSPRPPHASFLSPSSTLTLCILLARDDGQKLRDETFSGAITNGARGLLGWLVMATLKSAGGGGRSLL